MTLCDNAALLFNFSIFFTIIHLKYPNKRTHFVTFMLPRWPTSCKDVIIVSTVKLLCLILIDFKGYG